MPPILRASRSVLRLLVASALLAAPAHAVRVGVAAADGIYEIEPFGQGPVTPDHFATVVSGLGQVFDVQYAGGRYYWTDVATGKLQTSLPDGSDLRDVVVRDLSGPVPRFLEVDAAAGKLYWTEVRIGLPLSGQSTILRADLDGSNAEVLYSGSGNATSLGLGGLVLDRDAQRIYFHDLLGAGQSALRSLALDGSDVVTLATLPSFAGFGGAIGLDPAGGRVFFAVGVGVYAHVLGSDVATALDDPIVSLTEIFTGLVYVAGEDALYVNYPEDGFPAAHQLVLDPDTGALRSCTCGSAPYPLGGLTLVPEPGTAPLVAAGLAALAHRRRRLTPG